MKLTVRELRFSYKANEVLRGLNLQIAPDSMTCLVGPNGSGKSTLLRCLDRILRPTQGTVMVGDDDLRKLPLKELARRISYVPQNCSHNFPLTVFEVVMMGRKPHLNFKVRPMDRDVVNHALEILGLAGYKRRYFDELSGGEKQKVFLARALAQEAPIMLLDEPTSNLDIHFQLEVLELLRRLKKLKNLAVVIAIHDLNLAARYADSLLMLNQGRIIAQGPPYQVLTGENIERVYKVKAQVHHNGYGQVQIWPLHPTAQATGPTSSL